MEKRNYGIDLLRIVSMFFVIVLHCIGKGGLLSNVEILSKQYKLICFLNIGAYSAVNIFALISGYVGYSDEEKKHKISNYIKLWLQVVFYGILVTFIFSFILPNQISGIDYIRSLLPVTNNLYWYFTAYTALFLIMPIINSGIRNTDEKTLKKLFILIIIVFSIFETFARVFTFANGYSFIWITLLYIMGAIIKKCKIGNNLKIWQALIILLSLWIITYLYKMYGFEFILLNKSVNKDIFVSYTSPTIVGISIAYLLLFSKLKFNNFINKVIKFLAPSAFAAYLLNNHFYIWNYVMNELFINISNSRLLKIFAYVMVFSFLFVLVSILIDRVRLFLFKILHINKLVERIDKV